MKPRKNYGKRIGFDSWKIYLILVFVSLGFLSVLPFLDGITGYLTFQDTTEANFNSGTYSSTYYNTSDTFVSVNTTQGLFTGTYTSQVFSAGGSVAWANISWCEDASCLNLYNEELPANAPTHTGVFNMSGNLLLMHF